MISTGMELVHAMRLHDYLVTQGSIVRLMEIAAPPTSWASPEILLDETCAHEYMVTGRINSLGSLAIDDRENATRDMLPWFVDEPGGDEENARALLASVRLVEPDGSRRAMLDKEIGIRVFNSPTATE